MHLPHRARWVEVSRAFTPGRLAEIERARSMTTRDMVMLFQGFTTVEMRCERCSESAEVILLGQRPED